MDGISIIEDIFGRVNDPITGAAKDIRRFTFSNDNGVCVQVITYGATITSIRCPDKYGNIADIALGFDDIQGYQSSDNPYFGASIGRVCNRIGNGKFDIDGIHYEVDRNFNDKHQLHGGRIGFDKFNWQAYHSGNKVIMTHINPDGFQGFPGAVFVQATYELLPDNTFTGKYTASVSKPTPINLTNHTYFNLAGHDKGHAEIYKHDIVLNADRITITDDDSIPTGKFLPVWGSPYDFRIARNLGDAIAHVGNSGFDDNYCVTGGSMSMQTFIASAYHPKTGRLLEVYADQPGVQLYTSNYMPDPNNAIYPENKAHAAKAPSDAKQPIVGKEGALYFKHGAFCLETQNFPDAVNHPNFPKSVVYPGNQYQHTFSYKLSVINDN